MHWFRSVGCRKNSQKPYPATKSNLGSTRYVRNVADFVHTPPQCDCFLQFRVEKEASLQVPKMSQFVWFSEKRTSPFSSKWIYCWLRDHINNMCIISKCIEVNEESHTSVKPSFLIAIKCYAILQIKLI